MTEKTVKVVTAYSTGTGTLIVSIPKKIREALKLVPGDSFVVLLDEASRRIIYQPVEGLKK